MWRGYRLKQVLFAGMGEPLVNAQIADIVKIISDSNITDRIGIVTNGTLLKPELAEKLIDAGLNVLRISLNGLSGEDYKKYTGVPVDFDQMYENIKFFYEKAVEARKRGKDISVYIKIMDYMIESSEEKKLFFKEKFEPICDVLNIENLGPVFQDVDYDKFGKKNLKTKFGEKATDGNICQLVFFRMLISPEGDALACCRDFGFIPHQLIMGNIKEENLLDIWNGEKYRQLRLNILKSNVQGTICDGCVTYKWDANKEDIIDSKREDLISYYDNKK